MQVSRHHICVFIVCISPNYGMQVAFAKISEQILRNKGIYSASIQYNLGPLSAHQRKAFLKAFRWRADGGPLLYAYWDLGNN